jgi:hypothetical protein
VLVSITGSLTDFTITVSQDADYVFSQAEMDAVVSGVPDTPGTPSYSDPTFDMKGARVISVADGVDPQDAATKAQLDEVDSFIPDSLDDLGTAAGDYPMGSHKLTGLAAGTTSGDSVRYEQLPNSVDDLSPAAGNVSMGGHTITNLADGVAASDAATVGQIVSGGGADTLDDLGPSEDDYDMGGFALTNLRAGAVNGESVRYEQLTAEATARSSGDAAVTALIPVSLDDLAAAAADISLGTHKITNLGNGTASSDAAAFGQIPTLLSQLGTAASDLNLGSHKITNLANGSASSDAAAFGQIPTKLSDLSAATGDYAMGTHKLTGLSAGTAAGHSVRYEQLPDSLDDLSPSAGDIAMGAHKITGLANGSSAQDAAAFGQIPVKLNDLGTAPSADYSMNSHKLTNLLAGSSAADAVRYDQLTAGGQAPGTHASTHEPSGSDEIDWDGKIHMSGAEASMPAAAAGNAGALYYATDTMVLFRSTGSAWVAIALPPEGFFKTGGYRETWPRELSAVSTQAPGSGVGIFMAIELFKGDSISIIGFWSGTTALSGGTHLAFGLYDGAGTKLYQSTDDTSPAWAANTYKEKSLTSTYPVTASGVYYVGITVTASTMPSIIARTFSGSGNFAQATGGPTNSKSLGGSQGSGLNGTLPGSLSVPLGSYSNMHWALAR